MQPFHLIFLVPRDGSEQYLLTWIRDWDWAKGLDREGDFTAVP